jgi:translation initiation factor 5
MAFGKAGRVNMDGSEDPFYRYTMPTLTIKVEGTTKMIKTQLTNIEAVAQAVGRPADCTSPFQLRALLLCREPRRGSWLSNDTSLNRDNPCADLVTYFGQQLSANSKYDKKTSGAYVTGNQNQAELQKLVFSFIKKFVSCGACGNPETNVSYAGPKKKQDIILTCISCGMKSTVDPMEKLCTFIIQHPMESGLGKGSAAAGSKEKDKGDDDKEKGKKKKGKKKDESEEEDEDWGEDVSEEAVKARRKAAAEPESAKPDGAPSPAPAAAPVVGIIRDKNMGNLAAEADKEQEEKKKKKSKEEKKKKKKDSDDEDDDWSMDVSEEAVKARQAALCAGMENVVAKAEQLGVGSAEHLN